MQASYISNCSMEGMPGVMFPTMSIMKMNAKTCIQFGNTINPNQLHNLAKTQIEDDLGKWRRMQVEKPVDDGLSLSFRNTL